MARSAPTQHAERSHADISPSGADRWWNCPGSVDLIAKLKPPQTTNVYSEQGTAAHELLERSLKAGRAPIAYLGQVVNKGSKAKIGVEFKVDRAMAVCVEEAIDYISSLRRKGDTILTEKELDIPATGQPGHVDVAIFCRDYIDVIDYKHGTNPVEIKGNKQAKLYVLGVLEYIRKHFPKFLKTIKKVRIHIIQPRSNSAESDGPTSTDEMTLEELNTFSEQTRAKVATIRSGCAPRIPGKIQCHYCPVAGRCKEFAEAAVKAARMDFDEVINKPAPKPSGEHPDIIKRSLVDHLSNKALGRALSQVPLIELWIAAVQDAVTKELNAGRKVPDWKLVEGRSQRRWKDEEEVKKALTSLRIDEDDYAPRRLLGLGAIEALLKPKLRQKFFNRHCVKPVGNPSLAPESDPRPHFNRAESARDDFEDDLFK